MQILLRQSEEKVQKYILQISNQVSEYKKIDFFTDIVMALFNFIKQNREDINVIRIFYLVDSICKNNIDCSNYFEREVPVDGEQGQKEIIIVQIFVQLYRTYSRKKEPKILSQMRLTRKSWVLQQFKNSTLERMQTLIKRELGEDVDSGFTQQEIEKLKKYYIKNNVDLSYLPTMKAPVGHTVNNQDSARSSHAGAGSQSQGKQHKDQQARAHGAKPSSKSGNPTKQDQEQKSAEGKKIEKKKKNPAAQLPTVSTEKIPKVNAVANNNSSSKKSSLLKIQESETKVSTPHIKKKKSKII